MKRFLDYVCIVVLFTVASCRTTRVGQTLKDDGKLEVVFVQINDVYEIAPLSGGKEGGMARVATLKKQYLKTNPNTFMVIAGDFVSPSVYNSLQYEGKPIRGRQMIDALNAAGLDFAVFGNHEFDINESQLQDRINESSFQWISSNSFHKRGDSVMAFAKTTSLGTTPFPKYFILPVRDKDGTIAKIGFIGLTLPFNKADFVSYTDPFTEAKQIYAAIKDSVDAVVAITHQALEDDEKLAKELPGLAVILGGHEHDMRFVKEGNIYITKAHANAKSAYIVKLDIDKVKKKISVAPQLKYIDSTLAFDSLTQTVVQKWTDIAEKNYSSLGFEAKKIILQHSEPLDGREAEIRSHSTALTKLVMSAIGEAAPDAQVALMNAGSIRVDDILQTPVTEYDIIRALPFGGGIRQADMKGSLLVKTLDQGNSNKGIGGFIQHNEAVTFDSTQNTWKLNGQPIDTLNTYRVAITEFLFSGKEANLDFLNPNNPDIVKVYPAETSTSPLSDIRLAIVKYLERKAQ